MTTRPRPLAPRLPSPCRHVSFVVALALAACHGANERPPSRPKTEAEPSAELQAPEPSPAEPSQGMPCVAQIGGSDYCFKSDWEACRYLQCKSGRCAYLYGGGRATTQVVCE